MITPTRTSPPSARSGAAGFSLVEMMIALAIALFLIAGMVLIFENTKSTYVAETNLGQLEDNERLAMTVIADVIQTAGYFPEPQPATINPQNALPASPDFPAAQNSSNTLANVAAGSNAQGDTVSVRYAAGPTDTIMNCLGQTNTAGVAPQISWDNTLAVDANGYLTCQVWDSSSNKTSPAAELVGGFATGASGPAMSLLYGVDTGTAKNGTCVDSYMTATQVTAGGYWGNVCSVRVTLKFNNPLDSTKPPITFVRVIALMNQAGVNS
jgi:type IV pilus assembly protein PilW